MKTLILLLVATTVGSPLLTSANQESPAHDIACEICHKKDKDGNPCKGKVTRESTSSSGITYSCSNGHTFTVEPKVRVR